MKADSPLFNSVSCQKMDYTNVRSWNAELFVGNNSLHCKYYYDKYYYYYYASINQTEGV